MIHLKGKYNILIMIGAFIILYNPPLLPVNAMHIVGLFSIIYLICNKTATYRKLCCFSFFKLYTFIISWGLYLFLVISLYGTGASDYLVPVYFILDVLPFGLAISVYSDKREIESDDLMNLFLCVGLIQAITTLLAFFIPSVQRFFVERLMNYGYTSTYAAITSWRLYGFSGTLTFETPVLQSILSIIAFYKVAKQFSLKNVVLALILAFSAIVNARTSFVVLLIGAVLLVLISNLGIKKKISILVIGLLVIILFNVIVLPWLSHYAGNTYKWIMEGIDDIAGFLHNNNSEYSYFRYATNIDKYKLPPSFFGKVFGVGHNTIGMKSLYGYSSDVGYTNDLWLGGIVYVVCIIAFFENAMWEIYRKGRGLVSFFGLMIMISFPVLNIKGIVYTMNGFVNLFLIIYIVAILFQSDKDRNIRYEE